MKRPMLLANLIALALTLPTTIHAAGEAGKEERPWCDSFAPYKADLSDTGKNPYVFLWPGYRLFLQHGKETLVISVLNETKVVDGVKTRVVEEREMKDGKLIEVSRNYLAISRTTGDVYYFGEVSSHKGTWHVGVNGARFGLLMPGRPAVGDRYYQEVAPAVAMDRAEVISLTETLATPAKVFEKCLRTRESSGLRSGTEDKLYAANVGLIKDGNLVLTEINCPLCNGKKVVP